MLGIKYSETMRKLYGYSSEGEFPDVWSSWMDCALPEDCSYAENSHLAAVKDYTGRTLYKAAANYLLSLINDVLQLSKLEDPDVTLSCEAFNVRELAKDEIQGLLA